MVGYLVFGGVADAMSPYVLAADDVAAGETVDYGVFGGILVGVIAALLWQRYYRIRLPPYLAFFGGRRFVPILTANAAPGARRCCCPSPTPPSTGASRPSAGGWCSNDIVGAGVYGVANRLLIPFGLHHILNSVPWFVVGEYETPSGAVVHGDIARFLAGDPTAGSVHDRLLPDHDVRAARRGARDLPRGGARAAQAGRRRDALRGARRRS